MEELPSGSQHRKGYEDCPMDAALYDLGTPGDYRCGFGAGSVSFLPVTVGSVNFDRTGGKIQGIP
jgi:hypothetical protein